MLAMGDATALTAGSGIYGVPSQVARDASARLLTDLSCDWIATIGGS